MKKYALGLILATIAGCSQNPATQPQVTAIQACATYNAVLTSAVQARMMGKLSTAQIDQITKIDLAITPICTGAIPTANSQLVSQVIQAASEIAAMEANK